MYRAAIKSIFSELVRQNRLVAIEKPVLEKPKTKEIASFINEFSLSKVLIITDELDANLYLSARNIPNVDVITVREINPVNLLAEDDFKGVVDLINMRAIYWNEEDQGLTFDSKEIPEDLMDKCSKLREEMLEAA